MWLQLIELFSSSPESLHSNIKIMCPLIILVTCFPSLSPLQFFLFFLKVTADSRRHMKAIHHCFFYIGLMWGKQNSTAMHTHRQAYSTCTQPALDKLSIMNIVIILCHRRGPFLLSIFCLSPDPFFLSLDSPSCTHTHTYSQRQREP